METYFKENSDIQEWVDLLIEKIFTVCLLSGSDADSEFSKGKEAAERISSILQGLTDLPEEILNEGIRQLIEQRLPDPRVIDNFPKFYSLMEEMIHSGIPNVQTSESDSNISSTSLFKEMPSSKILLTRGPEISENSSQVYIPEIAVPVYEENVAIDVFAPLDPSTPLLSSTSLNESIISTPLERVNSIPSGGEQLFRVLKQFYPEEQPQWNVNIDQYSFFTQINNLVVYIAKENSSEIVEIKETLEKQGCSVVICHQEDLAYPRRLERFIHQTLRHTVNTKTSTSFLS